MRIENDIKLGFKDVMIRPKRSTLSSRAEVSLVRKFKFLHGGSHWEGIPVIAANMDTVGTMEMAKTLAAHQLFTTIHKHYSPAQWKKFLKATGEHITESIAISTGTSNADAEKLAVILKENPLLRFICIDVANGYSEKFVSFVKSTRKKHPGKVIMAGNVVTGEMVEELLLAGADIIKVGIGPGSVCTTRVKTGVGYPQLSAIIECADAAHGLGGQIISDGGCKVPGDVAKAFGGGADFVMLGGMLAGHEESGGELVVKEDGTRFKQFYGMSSETAMQKYASGVAEYRASEGKTIQIPYRGNVSETVLDILGGLRSTCTYVGAQSLKELSKRTTFIRVQEQHNDWFEE
ncbi:MAG: GMP reductase [Chitinophagaceae bacterium]|nr:GMP reductase [Chitinophagaceae bacterium]MBL0273509.1 GMP reductase [Chitinophagaceae bacterium]